MTSYNQGYPHTPHSITFIWRYNYSVLHSLLYNKGEVTRGREEGIVQPVVSMTRRRRTERVHYLLDSCTTNRLYQQDGTRDIYSRRGALRERFPAVLSVRSGGAWGWGYKGGPEVAAWREPTRCCECV